MNFKLRIRLPDGRSKLCGCGTRDRERYDKMRQWVQDLKHGKHRRIDVLETIVVRGVSLPDAFDSRHDPDAILGLSGVRDLEPYLERWHREKANGRKGASSADKYARQVRQLIPKGEAFPASRFTALEIKRWLRGLSVQDPTRNRIKAALSSFGEFLTDEGVLQRNPVRDVRGFSEGDGRSGFYELHEAKRFCTLMGDVFCAAFALAVCAGIEWQVITRLRVRDVDLAKGTVWADGGKTAWRRRLCRILFLDTEHGPVFKSAIEAALRDKFPDALLFPGLTSDKILLREIEVAAEIIGVQRLTFHDQRHTHAVNALKEGYSAQVVAHQLGHSNTNLVWSRYGRYTVDERDYQRAGQRDGTNG